MANRILGITVDIEGKTSGLTQSLKEANSAISKTTTALRDVDKALALDPTNVELLAQKDKMNTAWTSAQITMDTVQMWPHSMIGT